MASENFSLNALRTICNKFEQPHRSIDFESSETGQSIFKGTEDEIVCLLLLQLPNLRILELDISGKDCTTLNRTKDRIVRRELRGVAANAMTRVQTAIIIDKSRDMQNFGTIRRVLLLPSLLRARFIGIQASIDHLNQMRPSLELSNIVSLSFSDCAIGPKTLCSLLRCIRGLRHFSLVQYRKGVLYSTDPYWIQLALEASARDSLESLKLIGIIGCHQYVSPQGASVYFIGGFQGFSVLSTIEVNLDLLIGDAPRKTPLGTELPASLRSLTVYIEITKDDRKRVRTPVQEFMSGTKTKWGLDRLPLFRNLNVKGLSDEYRNRLPYQHLEEDMHKLGVAVHWDFNDNVDEYWVA